MDKVIVFILKIIALSITIIKNLSAQSDYSYFKNYRFVQVHKTIIFLLKNFAQSLFARSDNSPYF
jgi:uncharacterized protein (UPF0371 family)